MTAHLHAVQPLPRLQPVRGGTADALARVAHFRNLTATLPEAHELDDVIRFLLGAVDDTATLMAALAEDLDRLWSLATDDFDDDQLDDLSEDDFRRFDFPTYGQEIAHRRTATVDRLSDEVDRRIFLARYRAAHQVPTTTPDGVA